MHSMSWLVRRIPASRKAWAFAAHGVARTKPLRALAALPVHHRGLLPAAVALCLGGLISTAALLTVQHLYSAKAQKEFEGPAARVTGAVGQALQRYLEAVKSASAFLGASKEVDRWEFFDFSREVLPRFPAVKALAWVPRVPAAAREAFERRAQEDGLFGFRFTEPDGGEGLARAAPRGEHFPLYYVEPFEGNERELGRDLAASPAELRLLVEARDTGQPVIAHRTAARPGEAEVELVLVLPVYRLGQVPESMDQRRDQLVGFTRAVLRLSKLIEAALPGPATPPGLDVYLYDEGAGPGQRLVAYYPSPLRRPPSAPLAEEQVRDDLFAAARYEIAGREWSIVVKPVDSYLSANVSMAAWGVFAIGLLLTLLLVQYLVSARNRTQLIERAVRERTADLRVANAALESEIRERERVELELRAAKQRAEVANRAKSDFLAMMGHELRTPLNSVIGFSEMLSNETLGPLGSEQYRGYAEDIQRSGLELLARINDILELTKIDADDFSLNEERLHLDEALKAVLSTLSDKLTAGQLALKTEVRPGLPALKADPRAIKQILLNLLSNAIKFTPKGGLVTIGADLDDAGRLVLQVRDTGIGIDPDHIELALQPFSQIDSSLARKYEGSGLGLALTKRLVALHGGTIRIDSERGGGTAITIVFPKERVMSMLSASEVA